jgi:hypothetical protein
LWGREREKVEKAEMAQLWIDYVVAVYEGTQSPTMMVRSEKAIQPLLLKE